MSKTKLLSEKMTTIENMDEFLNYFTSGKGIEIGGLSQIFKNEIPIYPIIDNLDGCNFAAQTIWEGNIEEGTSYNFFEAKKGYQYICEASNLTNVPSEHYDFLISSHCLEHCANTLKTIKEWLRVIKIGGVILLILPYKEHTFDHNRAVTKFEHLIEDYEADIDEHDLTHLEEILSLHDLNMDIPAGTIEQFRERSLENYSNRCLHHHVFDFDLLERILNYNDVEIKNMSYIDPFHQIILGIKK
jgi:SAM-dependent methyltransferase